MLVVVVRTGGIAGMRREWRAEREGEEATALLELIHQCPWDQTGSEPDGADRYQWHVTARCRSKDELDAALSETDVDGPWRALIDEVRTLTAPRPPKAAHPAPQ